MTKLEKQPPPRPLIEITPEMIDAGVSALAEFQEGDGSTLAERVSEVFLHMISRSMLNNSVQD